MADMVWTNTDLDFERHTERRLIEDYEFMISNGEAHENALRRLGISADRWRKITQTIERRKTR